MENISTTSPIRSPEAVAGVALRPALPGDRAALNELIARSARELSRGWYSEPDIEALIRYVFGVDTQLIADGTYYLIERAGGIQACGGWSARQTLFGGDQAKGAVDDRLNPAVDAARIRAFFVHPDAARQGLGLRLLRHCESEAHRAGFRNAELMATLPGEPFYRAAGYRALEPVSHPTPDGRQIRFVRMGRSLMTQTYADPEREQVLRLAAAAGLPTADLAGVDLSHFLACGRRDRPDGVVGLEVYGAVALLRSLAVDQEQRGAGKGKALVEGAETHARAQGVREIYLLTTTAETFFRRLGYVPADRASAPPAIRDTPEFSSLCPSTAAFMVKRLEGTTSSDPHEA